MHNFTFITGNQGKADNIKRLLGIDLQHKKIDLDEIQSISVEKIMEHKVKQAYDILKSPVMVDDVSMWLESLSGLPGPFVKFFVTADNGLENICRMADGLTNRRAIARSYIALYDGISIKTFYGEIKGDIADHPTGDASYSYGWDSIFCPDGYYGKTRAELNQEEYDVVYEQIRPFTELRKFLTN